MSEQPGLTDHALERERRRTLARFYTTFECHEDCDPGKPAMEPHLLRTGYGNCDRCQAPDEILHRFELHEDHLPRLTCSDGVFASINGLYVCDGHLHGTLPDLPPGAEDDDHGWAWCVEAEDDSRMSEDCPITWWLKYTPHVPWLCPRCWKQLVAEETEHLAAAGE